MADLTSNPSSALKPVTAALLEKVAVPALFIAIGFSLGYMHARGVHKRKAQPRALES